jgi:hypothetical protein
MNFCLQDAFNLGWKLAAAAAGRAPDWLLDSYVTERLPEINALLDDVRRQLAIQFNFDDEHVALKHFLEREVIPVPAVNLRICENLSGLSARYEGRNGAHEVVGRRLPNFSVSGRADAKGVFELLRRQYFVLLDLTGRMDLPQARAGLRVEVAAADAAGRAAFDGVASVLVRPDGHVAWAGDKPLDQHIPDAEIREWLNIKDRAALFEPASGRRAAVPERVEVAH